MEERDLLEKMDLISPEFVEEASKPFERNGRKTIIWASYVGIAASFVLCLVSAFLIGSNGLVSGNRSSDSTSDMVASVINGNGNLPLILLVISLVGLIFFIFLLIRNKKSER